MTRKFCSTAAFAAAILSAFSTASWASTSTMVDSAGTAVVVDGRKASQRSDGVNSGGVNGGQILVVPQTVKEVARDLSHLLSGKSSIVATCSMPAIYGTAYSGPEISHVRVTNYAAGATPRFGEREYLRNDGDYLQAKGNSNWNQTRIYKTPSPIADGLNDLTSRTFSSKPMVFSVKFDKTVGYSVTVDARGAASDFGIPTTPDVRSYAGKRFGLGGVGVPALNHPIIGLGTVNYSPAYPSFSAYKYLSSHSSYGGSSSQIALQTGKVGKYPPYYGGLLHTAKIIDVNHKKDALGRYSPTIELTVETIDMPGGQPFYAGFTQTEGVVATVRNLFGGCSGYGCQYAGWTITNGYTINRAAVNTGNPSMPFRRKLTCNLN